MTVGAAPEATFTKVFDFSASHTSGAKVFGHNYRLHATFDGTPEESAVVASLEPMMQKVRSRDLGLHVDFLKGVDVQGASLARAFWDEIARVAPSRLVRLTLERDARAQWTLEAAR